MIPEQPCLTPILESVQYNYSFAQRILTMRTLKPYTYFTDAHGDAGNRVVHVSMSVKARKAINKNVKTRRKFLDTLIENATVDFPGCNCNHCQNDWDCCGKLVPRYPRMVLVNGGVKVVQYYVRNI